MALYRFSAGVIARGRGHSSTAAAAYRAGERITDERTGQTFDYSRRTGVQWKGIYAPTGAPEWMQDRAKLWNAVEQGEKRKDARTAREFIVCIPHELNPEQGRRLLGDFLREQFARKGFVVDAAIHGPGKGGDERNVHAHFLVTTRQVEGGRFVEKKDRTQNEKATLEGWRAAWAKLGNRHLERAGHAGTLDHRNYEDQGIDRTPGRHKTKAAVSMERRGVPTEKADQAKAADARRLEIAEIKAELARLEATPDVPEPAARPANDEGEPKARPANDNAPKREAGAATPILRAAPPPALDPAAPLALEPLPERFPVPLPPTPTVAKASLRAEEGPTGVEVSPNTSKPAERPLDASTTRPPTVRPVKVAKPKASRKSKLGRGPSQDGIRTLFAVATGLARNLFGKGRDGQNQAPETPPPSSRPQRAAAVPKPPKLVASVIVSSPALTPATPPLPPTPTPTPPARPKPFRLTPAQLRAELEEQRVRRERSRGGPDL